MSSNYAWISRSIERRPGETGFLMYFSIIFSPTKRSLRINSMYEWESGLRKIGFGAGFDGKKKVCLWVLLQHSWEASHCEATKYQVINQARGGDIGPDCVSEEKGKKQRESEK